jgi:hypothetical protein
VAGDPEAGTTATGTTPAQDALRRLSIGMGLGGDAVRAHVQQSSGSVGSTTNFVTTPDGSAPLMRLPRDTGPVIDRDAALEADTIIHELTHGTSSRIIGNGTGLIWSVGRGLSEGWSEFYALSLLNNTNADDPNGRYVTNAYTGYKQAGFLDNYAYGLHRFPYTTDNSVNPLSWKDVDDVTKDYSGGMPISPLGLQSNGGLEARWNAAGVVWAGGTSAAATRLP